MQDLKIK